MNALRPRVALAAALALVAPACAPTRMAYDLSDARFARAGYRERTVRLDNGAVHYWIGGEGPPLVLLHGFGGNAAIQWDRQAAPLARHFTVLMPDLLFFGESTTRRPERSVEFQAETVRQLLDHEGLAGPVDLMGVSYGGFVAWALAAGHPERVGRVVLVDSPGPVYTAEDLAAACRTFGVARVHELLLPDEPEDVQRILGVVLDPAPRMPRWIAADVLRDFQRADQRAQSELMDDLVERLGQPPEEVPAPPQPTLLVWGADDQLFPVAVAERLQALLGDRAALTVIPDTAHGPNKFRSRAFNEAVLAFLVPEAPAGPRTR